MFIVFSWFWGSQTAIGKSHTAGSHNVKASVCGGGEVAAPLTKGPKKAFLRRVYLSVFYSTTIVLIEPKYS